MSDNPSQMIDLANLTPEMIEQLKGILGTAGGVTRTPAWKPLKDMRPPTTAKGRLNRPHFEWSAEDDGMTVIRPFPRLYWDKNGKEMRVESAEMPIPQDWTASPPIATALDATAQLQAQFDALSPEDQIFVLEAQKQARLKKIHDLMSGLSEADIASFSAAQKTAVETPKAKKSA